jgi:lipopolysaccharide transport system permease protein
MTQVDLIEAASPSAAAPDALAQGAGPTRKPELVIRPSSGWTAINFKELWNARDLMVTLALRDLRLRYKQTALGVAWVVLQPLMTAGVFTLVFAVIAGIKAPGGVPYFLFAFAGTVGWSLFAGTWNKCSGCLIGNAQLISKVFFPRLVLPFSTVPSVLVDYAVSMLMMVGFITLLPSVEFSWALLLVPVWTAILIAIALGVGLITSALTVSYRDVQYILPVALQILMYASPVAYPAMKVPESLRWLFWLNPLAAPLEGLRWSLVTSVDQAGVVNHGGTINGWGIAWSLIIAGTLLSLGAYSFKRMERRFADVI